MLSSLQGFIKIEVPTGVVPLKKNTKQNKYGPKNPYYGKPEKKKEYGFGKKVYVSWEEVSEMVQVLGDKIKDSGLQIDYVSGIPRVVLFLQYFSHINLINLSDIINKDCILIIS